MSILLRSHRATISVLSILLTMNVILFSAIATFLLLQLVKLFVPLRMDEKEMEEGDLAVHGHEVYPSDVPSLSFPAGTGGFRPPQPLPEGAA